MENASSSLTDATIQQIHLELIRRTERNFFYGERIAAGLLAHRQDWRAVLVDTDVLAGNNISGGLVKLRDMDRDFYNVDTLYILAVNEVSAHRLATLALSWRADSVKVYTQTETRRALGGGGENLRLVEMWWD